MIIHMMAALWETLQNSVLPAALLDSKSNLILLADAYKQIMAPVGELGLTSLQVSTEPWAAATKPTQTLRVS
jgi:hypothetical protein